MILALQVVGLFFGIWYGSVNVGKIVYGQDVAGSNFIIMSAAWTSFITATWLI
jgi:hypothetical protein